MHRSIAFALGLVLCAAIAITLLPDRGPSPSAGGPDGAPAGETHAELSPTPHVQFVHLDIENHAVAPRNGSFALARVEPRKPALSVRKTFTSGTVTAGPSTFRTEVSIEFLGADDHGDHFALECSQSLDGMTTTSQKTVIFDGAREVLFENDAQRVVLGPATEEEIAEALRSRP